MEVLEPIILKRKSNLSQFRVDSTIYAQNEMDYEKEGEPITDEKFNPTMNLIGSMQNITPHYDSDRGRWSFYGGVEDLQRIAKQLSLEDKETKKILTVDESTLSNRFDPFWAHKTLWSSLFVEENARYLEPTSSLNELYIRILRGREDIQQPDRSDQSTFDTDKSNLEIISPEINKKKKTVNSENKKKAMRHFLELCDNHDKLKIVAEILNPANLDFSKGMEAVEVLIQEEFVNNDEFVKKYNATAVDQFIKVCELSNEDKMVYQLGMEAIRYGIVRISLVEGYSFKGEKINSGSIKSDVDLFNFLKKPDNAKLFIEIEKAVETAKITR